MAITPLFLRAEDRIRGLRVLLGIALRVLTLTEFVVRRDLATTGEKLQGLHAGNPNRATAQPTAERLLKAFNERKCFSPGDMPIGIVRLSGAVYADWQRDPSQFHGNPSYPNFNQHDDTNPHTSPTGDSDLPAHPS